MGEIKDKIQGKAKQVQGKVSGNRARMAEGKAQEVKGEVEGAARRAQRKVKSSVNRAKRNMSARQRTSNE